MYRFLLILLLACPGAALATEPATTQPADRIEAGKVVIKANEVIDQETSPTAFMGVTAHDLRPEQAAALDLPEGVGLGLAYVMPDSPAAQAGLKSGDILHLAGEQILINGEQLRVLVRLHQPGDTMTFKLYRDGEPHTIPVKLGQAPDVRARVPSPRIHFQNRDQGVRVKADHMVIEYGDGEHRIRWEKSEAGEHVRCKNLDGEIVYEGPIDTEEQRGEMPEELRGKIDKMKATLERHRVQIGPIPPIVSGQEDAEPDQAADE